MAKAKGDISKVASDVYGIVKWFNNGFGRITIKDYGEVFVHFSQIVKPAPKCYAPQKFLLKGQTVKCELMSGPKGLQARKVVVVIDTPDDEKQSVTSDVPDSASDCDYYYDDSSSELGAEETKKGGHNIIERDLRGEVISFFEASGYGFVKIHQYGSIFCHHTNIFTGEATRKKLVPTQIVKCDVARGPKGMMAVNVHVICDASPTASVPTGNRTSRDSSASRQPKKSEKSTKEFKTPITKVDKQLKQQPKVKTEKVEKQETKANTKDLVKGGKPPPSKKQMKQKEATATKSSSPLVKGDSSKPPILHSDVLGEVLQYNSLKGFGFIKVPIHNPVFVHKSSLEGCEKLDKGQIVQFDIVQGPKSLMAVHLKVKVDTSTSTSKTSEDKSNSGSKKKKEAAQSSNISLLMNKSLSDKTASGLLPPAGGAPFMQTVPDYNIHYHQQVGSQMSMQQAPYPTPTTMCHPNIPYHTPFSTGPPHIPYPTPAPMGPPPPYMRQPQTEMPVTHSSPYHVGQMVHQLPQMLEKTHISAAEDPFAKPQDPKPSSDRRLQENVTKELICGICEDLLENPVITPCDHLFCRECLLEWLPFNPQCPIDRKPLSNKMIKDAPKVIQNLVCKK